MKKERDTGYQSKASRIPREIVRFNPRFPNIPPSSKKIQTRKRERKELIREIKN